MAITVSAPQNIGSPNGNSLALYKDASTGLFYVKDINGKIEPFSVSSGFVSGSGIAGQIPKWKDASTLEDSVIQQGTNGNIGINTVGSNPADELHVNGIIRAVSNTVSGFSFIALNNIGSSASGIRFQDQDGVLLLKDRSNVETVNIRSKNNSYINGGNLGIGTTNPTATLTVEGNEDGTEYVGRFRNTGTGRGILVTTDSDAVGGDILSLVSGSPPFSGLAYKFWFGRDGRLGLGSSNPQSQIEVNGGDIEVKGSANGVILESPDATRYRIQVENGGTLSVTAI